MPHLSRLYRFLTVLYAVFGFGRIFLRFCGFGWFFPSVLRFLIYPNAPLLSVTSTSWKRRKKSRKCEGEMRRHVFCEVTQRFGDKHSRTCRRLIQFNINCLKHSFYSTGPLLLLSVCFFQDERYSLKERWNGPPIAIRYNRSYRFTVWWKDCYVTPAASAREVTRSHLEFWSWLVVVGTFVLGLFWRNMPQFYWVYYFWSQA